MSETFGQKIRKARKTKGITQKRLAELVGAKHNSVSDWENDKSKPDMDTVELLCGALDVTPSYLMGNSNADALARLHDFDKDSEFMDMLFVDNSDFQKLISVIIKEYYISDDHERKVINSFIKRIKENM